MKLGGIGMGYERGSDSIHEIVVEYERGNVARSVMDFVHFWTGFFEEIKLQIPGDRHHYRMNTRRSVLALASSRRLCWNAMGIMTFP